MNDRMKMARASKRRLQKYMFGIVELIPRYEISQFAEWTGMVNPDVMRTFII